MRKIEIVLTKTEKEIKAIDFLELEEYILINLTTFPANSIIDYLLTATKGHSVKNSLNAQEFIRLKRSKYDNLILGNNLLEGQEIQGAIYIGSWMEIMLFDIHMNIENLVQDTEETGKLNFVIGDKNSSNLTIKESEEGSYRLNKVMSLPPKFSNNIYGTVFENSHLSKIIEQIHKKIKFTVKIENFKERQSADRIKHTNTHNFLLHY